MAELTIREVEPAIVARLQERAEMHRRSIEEEHKAILRLALLGSNEQSPRVTFEEYLRMMPDVGTDEDFSRIQGTIRDVDLTK
jgi:plasmid stability protein